MGGGVEHGRKEGQKSQYDLVIEWEIRGKGEREMKEYYEPSWHSSVVDH